MLDLQVSQIIIQIIAFLVMLWVMKRYGWKPLLEVLDERREKIQAEFDSIAAQKEETMLLDLQYREKLQGIEADRRKKIQEAIAEGQKMSVEIQEDAQAYAKEILKKSKLEIEEGMTKAKSQLKVDMVNLVVDATKKILQEELDASQQKSLIINFLDEAQLK